MTATTKSAACIVLLIALLATPAIAIRASPAQVIIPEDGAFLVRVLDTDDPAAVTIRVAGDLAGSVTIDEPSRGGDGTVHVTGRIVLPAGTPPGDHVQELIIGLSAAPGAGTVAARAEVAVPLIARVPYPDAYLLAYWNFLPDRVTVTLENRGRFPVTPERITVSLADGGTALSIGLPVGEVLPGAFLRREAALPDAPPGVYAATLTIPYAATVLEDRRDVAVGAPVITVTDVAYDTAERGVIVPVDVSGSVAWNRPLDATVTVFLDDRLAADATAVIAGGFRQRLYVDTAAVGAPNRTVRAVVSAGGASAERTVDITAVVARRPTWVIVALGATLALLVLIALLWRRRHPPAAPPNGPPTTQI